MPVMSRTSQGKKQVTGPQRPGIDTPTGYFGIRLDRQP
jgi:hypothetical protein